MCSELAALVELDEGLMRLATRGPPARPAGHDGSHEVAGGRGCPGVGGQPRPAGSPRCTWRVWSHNQGALAGIKDMWHPSREVLGVSTVTVKVASATVRGNAAGFSATHAALDAPKSAKSGGPSSSGVIPRCSVAVGRVRQDRAVSERQPALTRSVSRRWPRPSRPRPTNYCCRTLVGHKEITEDTYSSVTRVGALVSANDALQRGLGATGRTLSTRSCEREVPAKCRRTDAERVRDASSTRRLPPTAGWSRGLVAAVAGVRLRWRRR